MESGDLEAAPVSESTPVLILRYAAVEEVERWATLAQELVVYAKSALFTGPDPDLWDVMTKWLDANGPQPAPDPGSEQLSLF